MKSVRREDYLACLHESRAAKNVVKVITGMRRCGKSTLLEQFIGDLRSEGISDNNMVYVNFDGFEGSDFPTSAELNAMLKKKVPTDRDFYVFFDEIQNVDGWERSIAALCTLPLCDVYITGSNSKMLSGELATHIAGRYIEIKVYPLSFREYSEFYPSVDPTSLFGKYLKYGALPEAVPERGDRFCDSYLEGVFNTVLIKDILSRVKSDDVGKITAIARFLYSNIGNRTSISSVADGAKISPVTVARYVSEMENACLFRYAERYDIVGKRLLQTNGKYYASDLGMRNTVLRGAAGADISRPLENIVFLELLRRGYTVRTGSYRDSEIDFVAIKGDSVEYYQVTMTVMPEDTRTRELRPLEGLKDNYFKTVLTMDRLGLGSEKGIRIANVIDWLLGR